MNLRKVAESDLSATLQDPARFGWPSIIDDNAGHVIGDDVNSPLYCQTGRINFYIDPGTGAAVEGSFAHVSTRIQNLIDAGFDVESGSKNWTVTTADIGNRPVHYAVRTARPDNTLGIMSLICENVENIDAAKEAVISAIVGGL